MTGLWVGIALTGGVLLWVVYAYNRFIRLNFLMKEAWSGMDVQLKYRYDLIPNLLQVVQTYATHEKDTFADVTRLRAEADKAKTPGKRAEAEQALSGAFTRLLAVAEAYPELKANENFLSLQNNLLAVEHAIQMARRYYNGTVREYNIFTESFPSVILANMLGYQTAEYFELESLEEREAPQIGELSSK